MIEYSTDNKNPVLYSGEEKYILLNYSSEEASMYCGRKHTIGAIKTEKQRLKRKQPIDTNDAPYRLYNICLRLGILNNTNTISIKKGKTRKAIVTDAIFSFLSSLPGASNMDEDMWLQTPEIWAFTDLDLLNNSKTIGGEDIRTIITQYKKAWCDNWICATDVPLKILRESAAEYLIPYGSIEKPLSYSGKTKAAAFGSTFFPESLLLKEKYKETIIPENELTKIKSQIGKLPLGYLSFRYKIPFCMLISV